MEIISYNISWKTMEGLSKSRINMNDLGIACSNDNSQKCIKNVARFINKYGPDCDFIALQEAIVTNYNNKTHNFNNLKIGSYFTKKLMKSKNVYISVSKNEHSVTLYSKKYKLIYNLNLDLPNTHNNRLCKGRAGHVLYLLDTTSKKYVLFINIHSGHGSNSTITTLNNFFSKTLKKIKLYKDTKIIIAGDFNNNIKHKKLKIKNQLMKNNVYRPYTCCNNFKYNEDNWIDTTDFKGKFDNVLSNYKIPTYLKYDLPKFPSSDHLPVYVRL